jgi:uracil-DNA glycosylase family 4
MIDLPLLNSGCTDCKLHRTTRNVCEPGFGPADASIMVVSKVANSKDWQADLEFELEQLGLDLSDIYFAQALKCKTFDQDASNADVKACRQYLDHELEIIKPKFVLCLGNEALLALTGHSGITKYRGRVYADPRGFDIIPTVSPSAVNRNPAQKPGYIADLRLFLNRVKDRPNGIPEPEYLVVDTKKKLLKLKELLGQTKHIFFDVETTDEYYKPEGRIVTLSATCLLKGNRRFVFALPLYHPESPWFHQHRSVLKLLSPELKAIPKVTAHNGAYDVKWMLQYGIDIGFTFDTMLALHLLNENGLKGLKPAAQARLGVEPWGIDTRDLLNKPLDQVLHYNVLDTWYMYHIWLQLVEELKEQPRVYRVFKHIMMAGSNELLRSEMRGIWLDVERLKERTPQMQKKLDDIEHEILRSAKLADKDGTLRLPDHKKGVPEWPIQKILKTRGPVYAEPNFNASKFARWMLFDHLGLDVISRGKDKPDGSPGEPSMAEDVMLELKGSHPVVALMLERVSYQKTLSSFFKPYYELYDENHRIHTNFKMAGTVTGRLSSGKADEDKVSTPRGKLRGVNLQQVPRDPFVRGVFGTPKGWHFIEADYSQVELRLVAFASRDETMLYLYSIGADIHIATAASVLGVPESRVSKDDRKKAKAVNFGFVYGMGWRKFIETAFLKYGAVFTEAEAQAVRRAFFEHFNGLPRWHERQRRLVRKYGRVQSAIGRVRHLPDIYSPDPGVQAEAERQAINSPIQALGSDMAVLSMVEINRIFRKKGIRGHCLGLVHDAINYEIKDEDVPRALPIIKNTMENTKLIYDKFGTHLDVPIIADVKLGTHWGGAIEMEAERVLDFDWDSWNSYLETLKAS